MDFNRLDDDDELEDQQDWHRIPTYDAAADTIPATHFEKIFKLISSTPEQAILLWHQCIQGILTALLLLIRMAINVFDLYNMTHIFSIHFDFLPLCIPYG